MKKFLYFLISGILVVGTKIYFNLDPTAFWVGYSMGIFWLIGENVINK